MSENPIEPLEQKIARLKFLEEQKRKRDGLPHLYGQKFYPWGKRYFTSTNKMCLLFAANQIGKSSIQIKKCIHWATEETLWPRLWKTTPRIFWYFYPDTITAQAEVEHKWIPEFLPRGGYKDSGKYGYTIEDLGKKNKFPVIKWNCGVTLYFKGYSKSVVNIQASTVHAIFCDEELPQDYFDEIMFRLTATDGYFSMVCTPTIGQLFWRDAIEPLSKDDERFPTAYKQQISMYDCLEYEDGSPTPWTEERIKTIEARCSSLLEIQKRVHGKFISDGGLKYSSFDPGKNVVAPYSISGWILYAGVDIGTGGEIRHPASISFIAVRPDFKKGAVYQGWRGDGIDTTSSDILEQFRRMRGNQKFVQQCYDHQARDFFLVSTRLGEPFIPAEKSQELGIDMLNTLFQNGMLDIFDIPELVPLVNELLSLRTATAKKDAKDDFIDSMRYGVTKIPFDWTAVGDDIFEKESQDKRYHKEEAEKNRTELDIRREFMFPKETEETLDDQINEWNSYYEG